MGRREKTSNAVHFSARFNPDTSEEDKLVLQYIQDGIDRGYNFKQIAQDAILKAGGAEPEMFSKPNDPATVTAELETLLARFAEDLFLRIGTIGVIQEAREEHSDTPTSFTKNFARSFLDRQKDL